MNSAKNAASLKIELGGGTNPLYHPNYDAVFAEGVDIVCDLTHGIPADSNSADLIFSRDFFEHLSFMDALDLLKECKRVLKRRKCIEFVIPDIGYAVIYNPEWNENTEHTLYGTKTNGFEHHRMWWTAELMKYILDKEGWHKITTEQYKSDEDSWKEPKFTVRASK